MKKSKMVIALAFTPTEYTIPHVKGVTQCDMM